MVRKTVTVLFADVTGSTAMGERLDPEALRRLVPGPGKTDEASARAEPVQPRRGNNRVEAI